MSEEIKNFREAVIKFDELQIELENIREALESNFDNYKNINAISADNSSKYQEILRNINTLQIQAKKSVENSINLHNNAVNKTTELKEEMGKYYSLEYNKTKKDFDNLIKTMQSELNNFTKTIESNIQHTVNSIKIDTSKLSEIIDKKIDNFDTIHLERYVDNFKKDMDATVQSLNKNIQNIAQADKKLEQINIATNNLNTDIKKINWLNYGTIGTVCLFLGLTIGFFITTYFKIDAVSNYYFSSYDEKQKKLEQKIEKFNKDSNFLFKNVYIKSFGTYKDTNIKFVEFKSVYKLDSKYTFTRDGSLFLGIK